MKKEYIKPSMMAIEFQHTTRLLVGSDSVKSLQSSGWSNTEDVLNLDDQGGGSTILDR